MRSPEIIRQSLTSDVFGHANAHNCIIEFASACKDLAVIAELDLRLVSQSGVGKPGTAPFGLRFTQGDSLRVHTETFRGVKNERTPAAANVEEALACPET